MALARRNDWSLDGVREVEDNGELDATFRTGTVLARLWAALKIKRKRGERWKVVQLEGLEERRM